MAKHRDLREHLDVVADLTEETGRKTLGAILRLLSDLDGRWGDQLYAVLDQMSVIHAEEGLEELGRRLLYRDYYDDIRSNAEVIAADEDLDEDDLDERIYSTAESYTTYTHRALHALYSSKNWQQIEEIDNDLNVTNFVHNAAHYAVEQDLREALDRLLAKRGEDEEEDE